MVKGESDARRGLRSYRRRRGSTTWRYGLTSGGVQGRDARQVRCGRGHIVGPAQLSLPHLQWGQVGRAVASRGDRVRQGRPSGGGRGGRRGGCGAAEVTCGYGAVVPSTPAAGTGRRGGRITRRGRDCARFSRSPTPALATCHVMGSALLNHTASTDHQFFATSKTLTCRGQ